MPRCPFPPVSPASRILRQRVPSAGGARHRRSGGKGLLAADGWSPRGGDVTHGRERGFALIMVLILSILLYVIIAEIVTTARMARFTGENDALMARMRNHMRYTLFQVEEMLRDDKPSDAGGEGGAGGAGGLGGLAGAAGGGEAGGAGAGGEEEEDLAATADGSQDAWFEPQGFSDGDITTYVWVEDENRKFNILTLVSSDEEFARESRARFIRLIDYLREDSQFDLNTGDGERLAGQIIEWMKGQGRTQNIPRPPLKSDRDDSDVSLMLHLDELRMLDGVTDELFYDQVLDNKLMLGLESVLTVSTAWVTDPGDPDKARSPFAPGSGSTPGGNQNPGQGNRSGQGQGRTGGNTTGGNPAGGATGAGSAGGTGAAGAGSAGAGGGGDEEPIGEGIRININTASRPVLRCLFGDSEFPPAVIEAILHHRNEEVPPSEKPEAEASMLVDEGDQVKRKMFGAVQDLEEIPEFKNLGNPQTKDRFFELTTTKSHVFTVHMASVFKRNEENRVFVMRRAASILVRLEDGEELRIHPIVRLEDRAGLRVVPIDFPDRYEDEQRRYLDSDQFAKEERAWNPFFIDFYKPREKR
jgi:type II secretory pathway component PulK